MDAPQNGEGLHPGTEETLPPDPPEEPEGLEPTLATGENQARQAMLPDMLEQQELKAVLEAMLFVSPESLSVERFSAVLGEVPKPEVQQALRVLQEEYDQPGRGVQLVEVAGGFRFVTRQDYATWVKRLEKVKSAPKLSRSALETLAIIAYKQPIVRGEIEHIRGVETSGVLRTLLERKLIRIVGRKEVPGRPIMYATAKSFLEHFGLRDLTDLPPLREFKELGESEQASLPVGDEPLIIDASTMNGEAESSHTDSDGSGEGPSDPLECGMPSESSSR